MRNESGLIELDPWNEEHLEELISLWNPKTGRKKEENSELKPTNPLLTYISENLSPEPLVNTIVAVRTRWKAVTLSEYPYFDFEFWHSHAGLYEWCFRDYDIACRRLHFFAAESNTHNSHSVDICFAKWLCKEFTSGKDWGQITGSFVKNYDDHLLYMGYCVLRPTHTWVVSRTAICLDERRTSNLPTAVSKHEVEKRYDCRPRLCLAAPCQSNILNASLNITAPEFIQEDPHLGPCATAATWTAKRHSRTTPAALLPLRTITHNAVSSSFEPPTQAEWDPTAGDEGLLPSQIRRSIERSGERMVQAGYRKAHKDGPEGVESERNRLWNLAYTFRFSSELVAKLM